MGSEPAIYQNGRGGEDVRVLVMVLVVRYFNLRDSEGIRDVADCELLLMVLVMRYKGGSGGVSRV